MLLDLLSFSLIMASSFVIVGWLGVLVLAMDGCQFRAIVAQNCYRHSYEQPAPNEKKKIKIVENAATTR